MDAWPLKNYFVVEVYAEKPLARAFVFDAEQRPVTAFWFDAKIATDFVDKLRAYREGAVKRAAPVPWDDTERHPATP